MHSSNMTFALTVRVLLAVSAIAVLAVLSEFMLVLVLRTLHPGARFTSVYAIVMFTSLCGILPSWPTPSRISGASLSRSQRTLVLIEVTTAVAAAVFAFLMYAGEASSRGIAMASVLSYFFVLVVSAIGYRKANQN